MKTYQITKQRDGERRKQIISEGLELRDAQKELLQLFNNKFDTCYKNWGIAVSATKDYAETYATPTFPDGTRWFRHVFDTWRIVVTFAFLVVTKIFLVVTEIHLAFT